MSGVTKQEAMAIHIRVGEGHVTQRVPIKQEE